jgi:hypothetical protein
MSVQQSLDVLKLCGTIHQLHSMDLWQCATSASDSNTTSPVKRCSCGTPAITYTLALILFQYFYWKLMTLESCSHNFMCTYCLHVTELSIVPISLLITTYYMIAILDIVLLLDIICLHVWFAWCVCMHCHVLYWFYMSISMQCTNLLYVLSAILHVWLPKLYKWRNLIIFVDGRIWLHTSWEYLIWLIHWWLTLITCTMPWR